MSGAQIAVLIWGLLGLTGGHLLHRNDPIAPSAWPMAATLGLFTLLLGLLECWARRHPEGRK